MYVLSTSVNRTIMSAYSQLLGLYPHGNGPEIPNLSNENLLFPPIENINDFFKHELENKTHALPFKMQPIPVHSKEKDRDYLLSAWHTKTCAINRIWVKERSKTSFLKKLNKEFIETRKFIAKATGLPVRNVSLFTIKKIYDTFISFKFGGKENEIPIDFAGETEKNMTFLYNFLGYYTHFGTAQQKRLLNAPFFNELADLLENKINNNTKRKFVLFSAHDMTILQVFAGLNLSNYECIYNAWKNNKKNESETCILDFPSYASHLLFELRENEITNKYYIDLLYNEKIIKTYDYLEFILLMRSYKLENFENLCKGLIILSNERTVEKQRSLLIYVFFAGLLAGITIILIFRFIYKKYIQAQEKKKIVNLREMLFLPS